MDEQKAIVKHWQSTLARGNGSIRLMSIDFRSSCLPNEKYPVHLSDLGSALISLEEAITAIETKDERIRELELCLDKWSWARRLFKTRGKIGEYIQDITKEYVEELEAVIGKTANGVAFSEIRHTDPFDRIWFFDDDIDIKEGELEFWNSEYAKISTETDNYVVQHEHTFSTREAALATKETTDAN